ncbi:hypothetical protein, partial [Sphingobacterium sp. UBA7625]|uniref:hypothetical protein n=1 Tax=Sphingobacterium sp. UBA7625 TaxID=1947522 RepID=UPI00257A8F9B
KGSFICPPVLLSPFADTMLPAEVLYEEAPGRETPGNRLGTPETGRPRIVHSQQPDKPWPIFFKKRYKIIMALKNVFYYILLYRLSSHQLCFLDLLW